MGDYNVEGFNGEVQEYVTKTCDHCKKNCPHAISIIGKGVASSRCTVCENTGEPYWVITDG